MTAKFRQPSAIGCHRWTIVGWAHQPPWCCDSVVRLWTLGRDCLPGSQCNRVSSRRLWLFHGASSRYSAAFVPVSQQSECSPGGSTSFGNYSIRRLCATQRPSSCRGLEKRADILNRGSVLRRGLMPFNALLNKWPKQWSITNLAVFG